MPNFRMAATDAVELADVALRTSSRKEEFLRRVSSVCVVKMSLGVPAVSVGDKFPTTPVVHVGFPKAKTIAELLEGKSKVLFVSLPGAFTPT